MVFLDMELYSPNFFRKVKSKCSHCKKEFLHTSQWVYKYKKRVFCCYNCYNLFLKNLEKNIGKNIENDFKGENYGRVKN